MKVIVTYCTAALVAISTGAGPVHAYDLVNGRSQVTLAQASTDSVDWVIQGLQQGGYRIISIKSTFLGRIRIMAENRTHRREIIVSRSTGVIFRDRIESLSYGKDTNAPAKADTDAFGNGIQGVSGDRSLIDVDAEVGGIGVDVDLRGSGSSNDQNGASGGIGGAIDSISDILGGS